MPADKHLSFDEGGKPYRGKGGHAYGSLPRALPSHGRSMWERWVGNEYNERRFNSPEERAFGITPARIIRLLKPFRGKWHHVYMDNAFFAACGTCRANKLWFTDWTTDLLERGDFRYAISKTAVTILFHEYMDNKIV
eukprot:6367052-Pyramimonas_sp.AAC.1